MTHSIRIGCITPWCDRRNFRQQVLSEDEIPHGGPVNHAALRDASGEAVSGVCISCRRSLIRLVNKRTVIIRPCLESDF